MAADHVQDILLREVIHAVLATNGAELTLTEIDNSFISIYNDIVGLDNPGAIPAWDEDVSYNTTNLRYVSHDSLLWLGLQDANKGNTPQDVSAFWARVSVGQLAHEINKDDTLDLGGDNEVTASEIKTHLDSNPQLGNVVEFVNAMEPPPGSPSETDGLSYILKRGSLVFDIASVVWQTGTKVKIDLTDGSPAPDFTDIEAGDFLCCEGLGVSVNNGSFVIDEVNAIDDFIVIVNPRRTDGSKDENPAPADAQCHSTHADWDGGCRDDRVTYNTATDKWIGQTPTEGATVFETTLERYRDYFGTDEGWLARSAGSHGALIAKAGGGQVGATLCNRRLNRFETVASANDSSILPPAVQGMILTIKNALSTLDIYPAVGEEIDGTGVDTVKSVFANSVTSFYCFEPGEWESVNL